MPEFGHTHRVESERYPLPDLLAGNTDIFGPERDIVLHDGGHRLVVGILKNNSDVFSDIENIFAFARVHVQHRDPARRRG